MVTEKRLIEIPSDGIVCIPIMCGEDTVGERRIDLSRYPVVDAVPVVHGRMEKVDIVPSYMWKYRCSCCHSYGERWHNYCPNCGAKLDL